MFFGPGPAETGSGRAAKYRPVISSNLKYNIKNVLFFLFCSFRAHRVDGESLAELSSALKFAPEFYYSQIAANFKLDFFNMLKFSAKLRSLEAKDLF